MRRIIHHASFIMLCVINQMLAQTPTMDSLKKNLNDPGNNQLQILFALCSRGSSLPSDSFMRYAQKAKQLCIDKKDASNLFLANFYIGKCYVYEGKADSALLISEG